MEYLIVNRPQIFQSIQTYCHWQRMSNLKIIILISHFSCLVSLLNLLEVLKSLAGTSCSLLDSVKHCNFRVLCTAACAAWIISVHTMKINSKVIFLLLMLFKERLHKIAVSRVYTTHFISKGWNNATYIRKLSIFQGLIIQFVLSAYLSCFYPLFYYSKSHKWNLLFNFSMTLIIQQEFYWGTVWLPVKFLSVFCNCTNMSSLKMTSRITDIRLIGFLFFFFNIFC